MTPASSWMDDYNGLEANQAGTAFDPSTGMLAAAPQQQNPLQGLSNMIGTYAAQNGGNLFNYSGTDPEDIDSDYAGMSAFG